MSTSALHCKKMALSVHIRRFPYVGVFFIKQFFHISMTLFADRLFTFGCIIEQKLNHGVLSSELNFSLHCVSLLQFLLTTFQECHSVHGEICDEMHVVYYRVHGHHSHNRFFVATQELLI